MSQKFTELLVGDTFNYNGYPFTKEGDCSAKYIGDKFDNVRTGELVEFSADTKVSNLGQIKFDKPIK